MTDTPLSPEQVAPQTYQEWCEQHGCDHAHCPHGCEHPQPFMHNGQLICGRCAFEDSSTVAMLPCTPHVCE
jgi:hypothetical protein